MTIVATPQPANASNIMNDMLSNMVTPEAVAAKEAQPPVAPATTQSSGTANQPATPNLKTPEAAPVQPAVTAKPAEAPPAKPRVETNFFTDEPTPEVGQVEAAPIEDDNDEPDMSDLPENPAAENFKKLREAIKIERTNSKKTSREFTTVKNKLEKYEKGEMVPEIIAAKDTEIQRLQQYEVIFDTQLSDEYQTLVVQPTAENHKKLNKLATDYGIPEASKDALINKIVSTESEKDRNTLITKYFPDSIAATEVKNLVSDMHRLGQIAIDIEKKPQETKQSLQAQYQAKQQKELERIANEFEAVGKKGWNQAIAKTASESLYKDLIMDPTNPEHNKTAEKNQHKASIQYSALVKELYANGLKTLPEKVATGLARMALLSIGGVGAFEAAEQLAAQLAEIKESSSVMATYMRPSPNHNGSSTPAARPAAEAPKTPQQAGEAAMAAFK